MKLADLVALKGLDGRLRIACLGLVGACVGLGTCVAYISNAGSYLSDDPRACINCHIMGPEYATWQRSSHGQVATCNDCHVPHDSTVAKYWFKGKDGLRHSALFTLRRERQVIESIPDSKEVIQANCMRCHARILSETGTPVVSGSLQSGQGDAALAPVSRMPFDRRCTDCHREVPHGRVHSLSSTPNAAIPPLSPVTPKWLGRTKTQETKP